MIKRTKIVRALVLIVLITVWTMLTFQFVVTKNADAIVRIEYTGFKNMFHTPYEYYAIGSGPFCRVSKRMVEKYFGEGTEKFSIYDDTENLYWWVSICRSKNNVFDRFEVLYLKTSFGEQYRLCYEDAQNDGKLPDTAALQVILEVTEKLCGEYLNNGSTPYNGHFLFIQHREDFLIVPETLHFILKVSAQGNITKIMEVPKNGDVAYFYFLDTE